MIVSQEEVYPGTFGGLDVTSCFESCRSELLPLPWCEAGPTDAATSLTGQLYLSRQEQHCTWGPSRCCDRCTRYMVLSFEDPESKTCRDALVGRGMEKFFAHPHGRCCLLAGFSVHVTVTGDLERGEMTGFRDVTSICRVRE